MNVLMAGSSIFEQWTSASTAFPGARVINKAIGGTVTADWLNKLEPLLHKEQPQLVCLYCGSNDVSGGIEEKQIVKNILWLYEDVKKQRIDFTYYAIIKAPQKEGRFEDIDRINKAVCQALTGRDSYVDFNPLLFCSEREKNLYREDRLHLTPAAYHEMARINRDQFWEAYREKVSPSE